jgi:sec-independent protein translocase protein TatA
MLEGSDLLIVAVIVLVLFGGSQLPKLARSLGEAQRELKKAMTDDDKPSTQESGTTPDNERKNGTAKT